MSHDRSLPTSTARCLLRGPAHIIVGMDSAALRLSLSAFEMDPRGLPIAEVFVHERYAAFVACLDDVYRDGKVRAAPLTSVNSDIGEAVIARWAFSDGESPPSGLAVTWRAVPALETPVRPSRLPAHAA